MSGPIVRKYGFPNFDKIFGKRDVQHGIEDEAASTPGADLPPDLPKTGEPADPNRPESSGKIAPATEFGSAVE